MKITKEFAEAVRSLIVASREGFDIRDLFVFGGLGLMGYGLWMLYPWLGFAVTGAVLMSIGLFVGRRG